LACIDTYKLQRLRHNLVEEVASKGITDLLVLDALRQVLRHCFVESAFAEKSYEDIALPIDEGQTISQPYTVAYQTQALGIRPGHKVLEIGTGSGYQCAVLCAMGAQVYTVERHALLKRKAHEILTEMGFRAQFRVGDGTLGWPTYAPYDAILVTAGGPKVPDALLQQLAVGGRLIMPVGSMKEQYMTRVTRTAPDHYQAEKLHVFKFVPLIGEEGWPNPAGK